MDVARRVGCSVQQVRNLERDGVLPPAVRSPSGYRRYDEVHVLSGTAYRSLAGGVGPAEARRVLRSVHAQPTGHVLELLDEAHARLHAERLALQLARDAVELISVEPLAPPRPSDALSISELAGALAIRPSALRYWEAERGSCRTGPTAPWCAPWRGRRLGTGACSEPSAGSAGSPSARG